MKEVSLLGLQKMLSSTPKEKKLHLLAILQPEIKIAYEKLSQFKQSELDDLSLEQLISNVHPSWFTTQLEELSILDRRFYISALPQQSREFLTSHFNESYEMYQFDDKLKKFVLIKLFNETFCDYRPLGLSFLQYDQLLPLATTNANDLAMLCKHLGLFDLLGVLKTTIKATTILKIERSLSYNEITFLNKIHSYQPTLYFNEVKMHSIENDGVHIPDVIFEMGITRLARALSKSSDHLLWYIIHSLDKKLSCKFNQFTATIDDRSCTILANQVHYTWKEIWSYSH